MATVHVSHDVSSSSSSLWLGAPRLICIRFHHMVACSLVRICVQIYLGHSMLAVGRCPPPKYSKILVAVNEGCREPRLAGLL